MPDAKNNAKLTGDTHLPEVEAEELDRQGGSPQGAGVPGTPEGRGRQAELNMEEGRPGRGNRHAGELHDGEQEKK
jgi:hypothetical protein